MELTVPGEDMPFAYIFFLDSFDDHVIFFTFFLISHVLLVFPDCCVLTGFVLAKADTPYSCWLQCPYIEGLTRSGFIC